MGLKEDWYIDIETSLKNENISATSLQQGCFRLVVLEDHKLLLNLIDVCNVLNPGDLIDFQDECQCKGIQVIHLWEDMWLTKKNQVLSRLKSILGYNKRVYGRSTSIQKISRADADDFLNQYHLQGAAGARYRYALSFKDEIVAVAAFSNKRKMITKGENYFSTELIRFATKEGITVTGGLTKLIRHYLKEIKPNDLMSYADRDWSIGKGYLSSGFKLVAKTPEAALYLHLPTLTRFFNHRLPVSNSGTEDYLKIFNTGNLKYILYL